MVRTKKVKVNPAPPPPTPQKKNILFILVDDLERNEFAVMVRQDIITPNIDACPNPECSSIMCSLPQCTPTRKPLKRGSNPFRNGWVINWEFPDGLGAHILMKQGNPSLVKGASKSWLAHRIRREWQIWWFSGRTRCPYQMVRWFCMWTGYEGGIEAKCRVRIPRSLYLTPRLGARRNNGSFGPMYFVIL